MSQYTPEHAFCEQWALSNASMEVPDCKQFLGQVPLLTKDETAEVLPPFATVMETAVVRVERTSEQVHAFTAQWQVEIQSLKLIEARRIGLAAIDAFNRTDFAWDRGRVLDMRPDTMATRQDQDGMWIVLQSWTVQYTLTPAAA